MSIGDRYRAVRAAIDRACERAGRSPDDVTLVAVSKFHSAAAVREAYDAGARDFGENYAQELDGKRGALPDDARWHFIGHLQRNKAKLVAGRVALVHAVDSVELAVELGKRASTVQPVLAAVNLGGEASKSGASAADAVALVRGIAATANVRLDGLMTMPPPDVDPRPIFEALRALRDQLGAGPILSMGMTGDFEEAISCGATHVRIGTAIFGDRPPKPE